ncbi:MAG: transglycosylase SLT domain-containing protein [Arenimonas sp.]
MNPIISRRFGLLLVALLAAPFGAHAQDAERRNGLRAAFIAADSGQLTLEQAARYSGDRLYPWLQASVLRRQLATVAPRPMLPLLEAMGEQPAARWLRGLWLQELARRQDWSAFRAAYRDSDDIGQRCADLRARMPTGDADAAWIAAAQKLWLSPDSLPTDCNAPMAKLAAAGNLDEALRWQRIDLAIPGGEAGVLRFVGQGLGSEGRKLVDSYASYLAAPAPSALAAWPQDERSRAVIAAGLKRLARRDPDRAQQLLSALPATRLDPARRGAVAYDIALWTVASYLPDSAQRLNAVPATAYDDKLHEWRVREAMSRGDDGAALAAITKMGDTQRADSRWQYFEARLRERLGQVDAAKVLYQRAAQSPSFHGWLAADRLQQPYALCPLEPPSDPALDKRVGGNVGLARALDLFAIERPDPAAREWAAAVKPMGDDERRIAVRRAIADGWFDRAVFGMNVPPDDLRYYSLRFPMHHETDIRLQSQVNALDAAWVAGQTRAESSFMPRARAGADARGLMQLLPGTAQLVAKRLGLPWQGSESLYDPSTNIRLGAAYMRQMLDRYDSQAYLAIAAYNAGPAPVERWRTARGNLDPDFFVESIPWKETREYVARVLAFSVVYDWRLNGAAAPLGERMRGRLTSDPKQRRPFSCPVRAVAKQ